MKRARFKIFTLILTIVFTAVFFASCSRNEDIVDVTIERGKFEKRIDYDDVDFKEFATIDGEPHGYMAIDSTIAKGDDQMAAVLHLMRVAEHNYSRAKNLARISIGGGEAQADKLTGKMEVRSLMIREGDKSYYQTVGRVYEGTPQSALGAAQILLDQGKRTYTINIDSDNEVTYKQEPKNKGTPTMTEVFPYASCDFNKGTLKTIPKGVVDPDEVDTTLKYKGEMINFNIYEDGAIKTEGLSVVYDGAKKLYTVEFELDLSDQDKRNLYTEKPRAGLRKSAGSDDLEYLKYKVKMELWDNGLLKTYSTEESWEATLIITSFLKPYGASDSKNTDYFSWDDDDCEIEEYVEEGIINLDWVPCN